MAKKILITGMNREQTVRDYFLKKELKILNSHYSLIRCLEDMGWEVEQRPVVIGEDLSGYDEVIVYLHSVQSFCQHLWDGLYAVKARPDCILAFDDWQVNQVIGGIPEYKIDLTGAEGAGDPFRQYLFDLYAGKTPPDEVKKHRQDFIDACDAIMTRQNRLMICAFAGGDLTKLGTGWSTDRMFQYNPNPYNMNRRPANNYGEPMGLTSFMDDIEVAAKDKHRRWIFASLIQNKTNKWLKTKSPTWEVLSYGAKRGEHKTHRVTEPEMCKVYNSNWGCLMPAYYHAGSGWWRSRVQQVVDAHSILFCEDEEGKIYGDAFTGLDISAIEQMDWSQLQGLAKIQHECLYDNHPLNKAKQREELTRVLEAK